MNDARRTGGDDLARLLDWALRTEGSTRSVALIRIGLVLTLWARYASDLIFFRHLGDGQLWFCALFFVVTPLALVGLWTRITVAGSAFCALYLVYALGHVKGVGAYTHHHTALLAWSFVWLALTPSGRSYSADRWRALADADRRKEPWPEERGNLWGMRLLALQTASVYFWTALSKCNAGFLGGARLSHYVMSFYTGSSPIDHGVMHVVFMLVAWGTVALEFSLAFGLFFGRSRRWLIVPGLLLHGTFYALLSVLTFTVTMWVLYLSFLDPDAVHRFLDRLQGRRPAGGPDDEAAETRRPVSDRAS